MESSNIIDNLVFKYISGNLVPVLGCELLNVKIENDRSLNIHEYAIKKVFHTTKEWPVAPQMLSELPLAVPDFDQGTLQGIYKSIPDKNKKVDLLTKLARLKNFPAFIIASVFKDFENEYKKIHGDESIEVFKNTTASPHGLPSIDFENNKQKLVYLFDDIDSQICSISDEQILESILSLSNTKGSVTNSLLSFLKDKTLLFIGCDFPDWFMRYCIRILSNDKFAAKSTYIVNDHPPKLKYQKFFFEKHKIKLIQTSPVGSFVNEFCDKVISQQEFENLYRNSRVFICYSKKYDSEIAREIYQNFMNLGVETFFDEEGKEIGEHEDIIQEFIMNTKTKLFVSVLSKRLVEDINNTSKRNYIRDVELDAAVTRIKFSNMQRNKDKFKIVPYFVDNEREYLYGLPEYINKEFRFGESHGGFNELFNKAKPYLS